MIIDPRIDNKFVVVVPVYNAERYIARCLESVLSQDYKNYVLVVIDDCSTDNTCRIINDIHNKYSGGFIVCKNQQRDGSALGNIVKGIKLISSDKEGVIVTIDGDDFLYNNGVLSYLNGVYQDKNIYMTYGQFVPLSRSYGKFCKPIPDPKKYRKSGEWFASHLRTFKNKLWEQIKDGDLRDENGDYYKVAGDAAYMYPLIEMCGTKYCKFIDEILYVYNDLNPDNDMKINVKEQLRIAACIRNKPVYMEL